MSTQIDLNRLRDTLLANQRDDQSAPRDEHRTILVTKQGELALASDVNPTERRTLARVQQDTFHARLDTEIETVERFMPDSTKRYVTPDDLQGWIYSFSCSYGKPYTMFAAFDGSYYQVYVLAPAVDKTYLDPHVGHIFADGRICFGESFNSGRKTLEDAYAKSVMWATGMSEMILSGNPTFPFSITHAL